MKKTVITIAIITLSCGASIAAEKKMTITGTVTSGTALGNITTSDDKSYSFEANTKDGSKIFKACQVEETCTVTAMVEDGEFIRSVISAKKVPTALLTIPGSPDSTPDNNVKKRQPIELSGTIVQGHNEAGGNFFLNAGKKKQYTLRYLFELDEAAQTTLAQLADSKVKVKVKGTLKVWNDGSAAFDSTQPTTIFR